MQPKQSDISIDGAMRMNRRVCTNEKKIFPQILELIQQFPISNESYKSISTFFRKNSLSSFPECDMILNFLIGLINSNDLPKCCHGVRCIYYVLCQKTFQFEPEFTLNLCDNLLHLVSTPDTTIFINLLKVLSYISTISSEYAQYVKQIIPLNVLNEILVASPNQKIIFSALYLYKMYLKTLSHSQDVYTSLCEVSSALIDKNQNNYRIINETIKLCLYFARKNLCWVTIFQKNNLLEKILSFLAVDSVQLKYNIIQLITNSSSFLSVNNINFQLIIPLINHENPDLQNAAVICVERFLFKNQNQFFLQFLLDMQLLENVMVCIQNGSFKSRITCISIFEIIINLRNTIAALYLDIKLMPILLELIPEIHDTSSLNKVFNIIIKMINFAIAVKQKDIFQELLDQFVFSNYEEVYEEFADRSQAFITTLSNNAADIKIADESFQRILHDINSMEEVLGSM